MACFEQSADYGWLVDPEGFWRLLQTLVYHADTLLQLSEGYRYREGEPYWLYEHEVTSAP
jgi:hypothetical protein